MNAFLGSAAARFGLYIVLWNWKATTYLIFGDGAVGRINGVTKEMYYSMFTGSCNSNQEYMCYLSVAVNLAAPIALAFMMPLLAKRLKL